MAPAYEWTQVLQIGETAQRYIDHGTLLADSIFDDGVKTGKAPEEFVPGYYKAGKSSVMDSHILFLQREGKMEYFDRIVTDYFTYVDSIPPAAVGSWSQEIASSQDTPATAPRPATEGATTRLGTLRRSR